MTRFVAVAALLLTGCASRPMPLPVAIVPPPPLPSPAAEIAPTPLNAGLSPAAALWHLRAGLNVAALACRGAGDGARIAQYNALLGGHRATLAGAEAAYAAEYRAAGGDWRDRYDDAQTRLYNFWGQARGRAAFCAAADGVLAVAATASDEQLAAAAPVLLGRLDRALAPPWIAVDPAVFGGAPVQMAAR